MLEARKKKSEIESQAGRGRNLLPLPQIADRRANYSAGAWGAGRDAEVAVTFSSRGLPLLRLRRSPQPCCELPPAPRDRGERGEAPRAHSTGRQGQRAALVSS